MIVATAVKFLTAAGALKKGAGQIYPFDFCLFFTRNKNKNGGWNRLFYLSGL